MSTALTGPVVAGVVLFAAMAFGLYRLARDGRLRQPAPASAGAAHHAVLADLGVSEGTPVTLLQFSSAFCAPCRATRVLCADVAARVEGVRHVEVDAESHLDAVRALAVRRTPTLLIVDADGRVVRRAVGQPSRAQLLATVDAVRASGVRP